MMAHESCSELHLHGLRALLEAFPLRQQRPGQPLQQVQLALAGGSPPVRVGGSGSL